MTQKFKGQDKEGEALSLKVYLQRITVVFTIGFSELPEQELVPVNSLRVSSSSDRPHFAT